MEVFDTFTLSTFPTICKTGEKSETDRITQANFSLQKKPYNFFNLQDKSCKLPEMYFHKELNILCLYLHNELFTHCDFLIRNSNEYCEHSQPNGKKQNY